MSPRYPSGYGRLVLLRWCVLWVFVWLVAGCEGPDGHWRAAEGPPAALADEPLPTLPSDLTNDLTPDQNLVGFAAVLWVPFGLYLLVSLARWAAAARSGGDRREVERAVARHRTSALLAAGVLLAAPLLAFPDWTLLAVAGRVVPGRVVATAQWTTPSKRGSVGHDAVRVETADGTFEFPASRALYRCVRRGGCRTVPVLVSPAGVTAVLGERPAIGGIRMVVLGALALWGLLVIALRRVRAPLA